MRVRFVYRPSSLGLLVLASTLALSACGGGEAVHCSSDAECSSRGLVCDVSQALCVECTRNGDCLGADEICVGAGICRAAAPCTTSRACPGQVCDLGVMRCVECGRDEDCPSDQRCERLSCVPRPPHCTTDAQCASLGLVCDEPVNECVQCTEPEDCVNGFSCIERRCRLGTVDAGREDGGAEDAGVDRDAGPPVDSGAPRDAGGLDAGDDPDAGGLDAGGVDAGPCAAGCPARPNSTASCENDQCVYSCNAPFADCDDNPGNGCEVNTDSDPQNCAQCARSCSAPQSTPSCVDGQCGLECLDGRGDCDEEPGNGCEVNTDSDPQHCGQCDRECAARPNSTPQCLLGGCGLACTGTFRNCDGVPGNGCEVNIDTDPDHCGGCNSACPARPGSVARCQGGCVYECAAGRFDCDDVPGCESTTACQCTSGQSQCNRPGACECVGCNTDGDCSAVDDDCVCPDCREDSDCRVCDQDGVCDVFTENCECSDCAALPVCQSTGGN